MLKRASTQRKNWKLAIREILKQAKTVEEIVSIESQIANVRAEIESMEGRSEISSKPGFI